MLWINLQQHNKINEKKITILSHRNSSEQNKLSLYPAHTAVLRMVIMIFVQGILFQIGLWGAYSMHIIFGTPNYSDLKIHLKFYVLFIFLIFKLIKAWVEFYSVLYYTRDSIYSFAWFSPAYSLSLIYHWDKGLLFCKIDLLWWISLAAILIFVDLDL